MRVFPPPLGPFLGPSWGPLGPSWAPLRPFWGPLGPSWGHFGGLLGPLGAVLGAFWGSRIKNLFYFSSKKLQIRIINIFSLQAKKLIPFDGV